MLVAVAPAPAPAPCTLLLDCFCLSLCVLVPILKYIYMQMIQKYIKSLIIILINRNCSQ